MSRRTLSVFVAVVLVASILLPIFIHPAYAGWYNSSWLYRKSITIDHTKVPSTQSNFPVLISITSDAGLSSHARPDGYDILFTASDGSTVLSHERESYSSGTLVAWVNVPTLSSSTDTVLYMYYGNSGHSTDDLQNKAGVWPSSTYMMVQHLTGGTHLDSTTHGNNGAVTGGVTQVAGKIGGADSFDGSSGYVSIPDSSSLNFGTGSFSYTFWFKSVVTGTEDMVGKKYGTATATDAGYKAQLSTTDTVGFSFSLADGTHYVREDTGSDTNWGGNVWAMCSVVVDRTQNKMFVYINNAQKPATASDISTVTVSTTNTRSLYLGATPDMSPARFFNGMLDELRIQNVVLSSDWITTSYNSMNSPSTFFGLGSEETSGPAFDFSLANSGGITVTQGGSGSNTITATLTSGSTQSVGLSCTSGLPTGATCGFSPTSGSPTFSSTLTISTLSSTPTGSPTITVTGTAGTLTHTTTFQLTVNAPATTVVTVTAFSPQYYMRGATVSYSGTVTIGGLPASDGTNVGIIVKDYLNAEILTEQKTTIGGAFTGSFIIGSSGSEGLWTLYAASGDGHDSKTFYLDASAPTSSVLIPAAGGTVTSVPTVSGSASDPILGDGHTGSGVASVSITIKRNSDGLYWTGAAWDGATWLPASGTTSWSFSASGVAWTPASYTIVSKATDLAGNVETPGAGNTFNFGVSITVTTSPSGLANSIVVDTVTYTSPQAFTWVAGSLHNIGANSLIAGAAGTRYVWTSWSDLAAQSHQITVPSSPTTYTANYQTQYYLTVSSGHGSPTGEGWYNSGHTATAFGVTSPESDGAVAGKQYVFTGWSSSDAGGYTGPIASSSVTMNNPITETASWKTQWQVSFAVSPSSPLGGTTLPTGTAWYDDSVTPIAISAAPSGGYTFSLWSAAATSGTILITNPLSASTTATIQGTGTITATFGLNAYTIHATAGLGGTIDPSGDVPVNDGGTPGFLVTASTHYHISDVKVDGASVSPGPSPYTYNFPPVHASHTIEATFAIDTFTITVSAGAHGSITPPGPVSVNYGGSQTFTISSDANYHIVDVVVDSTSQGPITSYPFTNVVASHAISASFEINAPTPVTVTGAYHGARVAWTSVGAASYNIYYNLANSPDTATQYTTGVTGTTYDVKSLPDTTWDKTCYYWVAPVGSGGEAPKSSWGSGSDKVWAYKIEITSVTAVTAQAGDIKVNVAFKSRYLDGPVTVELEIGEYLGPGIVGNVPNRPITIQTTGPVTLSLFQSAGGFSFETVSNGEITHGSSYKAWVFLWNRLPSDPGYWEAYSAKAELIPITIP